MRLRNVWVGALALAVAATVAACGGKQETSSTSAEPPPGATKVDAATAGEVSGTVALDGAAPMNEPIKVAEATRKYRTGFEAGVRPNWLKIAGSTNPIRMISKATKVHANPVRRTTRR